MTNLVCLFGGGRTRQVVFGEVMVARWLPATMQVQTLAGGYRVELENGFRWLNAVHCTTSGLFVK